MNFVVSNQTWLKIGVAAGTVASAAGTIGLLWNAGSAPDLTAQAMSVAAAAILAWLAHIGVQLARFFNHTLIVNDDHVVVQFGAASRTLHWSALQVSVRQRIQTVELRDMTGHLVYAVDWYATNARKLIGHLEALGRHKR